MKVKMSISVDKDIKEKADSLFKTLGLDFSTAVNIFLHQCILIGDIPLRREYEIENAILEAETIARDP